MKTAPHQDAADLYREKITEEIFKALGLSANSILRRGLEPVFRLPARRLGGIVARSDEDVRTSGLSGGCRRLLAEMSLRVSARGAERIPKDGPLLILSNHPGAYDAAAIMAFVPRRDIKVILSDVPFTRAIAACQDYFIYAPLNNAGRAAALWTSMGHLQNGGSLLFFPHDEVEPDPESGSGAEATIQDWSHSIEIIMRRVPGIQVQVVIVGGILLPRFLRHPLAKVRKSAPQRQKLAEVLQIISQLAFRSERPPLHLSFGAPIEARSIPDGHGLAAVREAAAGLLEEHLVFFKG